MQRLTAIDSVVLQALGDGDLRTAERLAAAIGGKLDVLHSSPIHSTKESRKQWKVTTGKAFPGTAVFVALIHHERGQSIPLLRYGNGKHIEIQFYGLAQYDRETSSLDDGAIQRRAILDELIENWDEPMRLSRLDCCIDHIGMEWSGYTNSRIHRALNKKQGSAIFKDTTLYYQPPKPRYVKVHAYDKRKKNRLCYPITRVEFAFMGGYWRNTEAMNPTTLIGLATSKADKYIGKAG